jgi:hypothetical protein
VENRRAICVKTPAPPATPSVSVALPLACGLVLAAFAAGPSLAQTAPATHALPPPAVPPLGPEPDPADADSPAPARRDPGQPVGPARTFEPAAPLPGGLVDTRPAGASEPVQAARPAPSIFTQDPGGAGQDPTFVPGAAEAGLIVADSSRVFGADALPAFGTAVAAAAGLSLSARLGIEYDDNVARTSLDEPPPGSRFTSKDDFILRPSFNVSAGRALGLNLLFANASLGRDFFLKNENINRQRINVGGGFSWQSYTGCSGRVQGGWSTRETNRDEFLTNVPGSTDNTTFFTNVSCEVGRRLVPTISFDVVETRFTPVERSLFDSNGWGISGSLGYALNRNGQVGLQASYRIGNFPNQPLPPELFPPDDPPGPDEVNSIASTTIGGFFVYRFSEQWFTNISLGYTSTDRRIPGIPEFSGITGNVSVSYTQRRFGATASIGRAANIGRIGGSNLQITENFSAAVNYRLRPRVRANAGFNQTNFNNDDFENPGIPGFPSTVGRGNDVRRIGFGFDVELLERLNMSADYSNRRRIEDEFRPGNVSNQFTIAFRSNFYDSRRGLGR